MGFLSLKSRILSFLPEKTKIKNDNPRKQQGEKGQIEENITMENQINIKLGNEDDVRFIADLIDFCLERNEIVPTKVESAKEIAQRLRTQKLNLSANQEELERMQKVISEKDEVILKAVEKLKNFEISRSNKIELKLNKQWSDLIQHLLESVDNIKEGMSGLMRQYDTILEKLNDENKEIKKERKNEPEQFARQIEEASEEKEVEFKEQDSEEKEELII